MTYIKNGLRGKYIRTKKLCKMMSLRYKGQPSIFKGKHHTKSSKKKLSIAAKKQWSNPENRRRMIRSRKGMKFSEDHKRKSRTLCIDCHKKTPTYGRNKKKM